MDRNRKGRRFLSSRDERQSRSRGYELSAGRTLRRQTDKKMDSFRFQKMPTNGKLLRSNTKKKPIPMLRHKKSDTHLQQTFVEICTKGLTDIECEKLKEDRGETIFIGKGKTANGEVVNFGIMPIYVRRQKENSGTGGKERKPLNRWKRKRVKKKK